MRYAAKDEQRLMTEIWDPQIAENPLQFVRFVFPWGKANTPLHDKKEPRAWQIEELERIAEHIKNNKLKIKLGQSPEIYQSATASGRGVGKSALTAWINLWGMSTILGGTCINTANTESQLKSRTWAEVGKWHTLSINAHWFDRQALSLKPANWFEKALIDQLKVDTGYYYSAAQLWSEEKSDAFAGAHNYNGMIVVFDEGSGIPKPIWTVSQGFFTEPVLHRYWFAFSNPRRNTGAFFECFHKNREFWYRRNLDSRTVEGTDHVYLNRIVKEHGEDSDEARIEVKGEFPKQGDKQFISRELVEGAMERELFRDDHAALIMGVDPARFGNDATVIRFRQGRDGRSFPAVRLKGKDNMAVANECAQLIQKYNPDAVCIDAGNGTGIIDRLRELGYKIHEVWFGSSSDEEEWANKRTQLWARMREWLKGGCIPKDDSDLMNDLVGPEYKFQGASDRLMLEAKEEMKRRGFSSPDDGDALACTFAVKVASRDLRSSGNNPNKRSRQAADTDYNILG